MKKEGQSPKNPKQERKKIRNPYKLPTLQRVKKVKISRTSKKQPQKGKCRKRKENSLKKKKHGTVMAKKRESEEKREKPKRHTSGALTPPVKMCHVATMCTALPLHPKSHV